MSIRTFSLKMVFTWMGYLALVLGVVVLALLVSVLYGAYVSHNKKLETNRRILCLSNLKRIGNTLKERHVPLTTENVPKVNVVLRDLDLYCPSGQKVHSTKTLALYQVVMFPDDHIVITENPDNHDTTRMKSVNKPYVRHCLYSSPDDPNSIHIGCWNDKDMVLTKIKYIASCGR